MDRRRRERLEKYGLHCGFGFPCPRSECSPISVGLERCAGSEGLSGCLQPRSHIQIVVEPWKGLEHCAGEKQGRRGASVLRTKRGTFCPVLYCGTMMVLWEVRGQALQAAFPLVRSYVCACVIYC